VTKPPPGSLVGSSAAGVGVGVSCGGIERTLFNPMMEGAGGVGVIVGVDKGALDRPIIMGAIAGVSVGVGVSTLMLIIDPPAIPSITTGGVAVGVAVGVGVGVSNPIPIINGAIKDDNNEGSGVSVRVAVGVGVSTLMLIIMGAPAPIGGWISTDTEALAEPPFEELTFTTFELLQPGGAATTRAIPIRTAAPGSGMSPIDVFGGEIHAKQSPKESEIVTPYAIPGPLLITEIKNCTFSPTFAGPG